MCVFKYHAFIFPVRPPRWRCKTIILPPQPRYLFTRCCSDENHCTNATDKEFCETLLAGFAQLKRDLIGHLVCLGVTNFKVMDFCCTTTCSTTANIPERLHGLRNVYTSDGVHLTTDGHKNLAKRSIECLNNLMATGTKKPSQATYFWRGFRSRRGSSLPRNHVGTKPRSGTGSVGSSVMARGSRGRLRGNPSVSRGFHPYRRWWIIVCIILIFKKCRDVTYGYRRPKLKHCNYWTYSTAT